MIKINKYIVERAPKLASQNRSKLKPVNSCYFCLNSIEKDTIVEYTDLGETALCSFCGVDSLIPGEVDPDTLEACLAKWFSKKEDE